MEKWAEPENEAWRHVHILQYWASYCKDKDKITNKKTVIHLQNHADNLSRELDPVSPPSGVKTS